MLKIFKYFRKRDWFYLAIVIVFIVAQVRLDLWIPEYMGKMTNAITLPGGTIDDVWNNGGIMLLCVLGSVVSSIIVGYIVARIGAGMSRRLRRLLFDKVQDFSMAEINKFNTSSLITRSTNDITQIRMFIAMGMQVIIKAPITAIWAVSLITGVNLELSMTTAIAVLALVLVIVALIILVMPKFRIMQQLTDRLNLVTRENLTGIRVVRAYNTEEHAQAKFEVANEDITKTGLFVGKTMSVINPFMMLIMNGLTLSVYWLGAVIMAQTFPNLTINFGNIIEFAGYSMQIIFSFIMLTMIFIMMPRAIVSARRINEVLDTPFTITDGTVNKTETGLTGSVELRHVSFRYPGAAEYVLKDVNIDIGQGETVAFIGSTGSGKSTLINLIPRFYDCTEGVVIVDGHNVKDYTLNELHNKIGYIPQQAVIFGGTIESNIAFGDSSSGKPTQEEIERAADIAQAKEFIENKQEKYQAHIAQGGMNISGGQKQRLAIARAIARTPEILIFDDSFSALDYKTDRKLRKALSKELKDCTKLIVAQRIGTIREADKIVVLESGNVVGIGRHDELMSSCKVYQEIAYSQLSKEELAS